MKRLLLSLASLPLLGSVILAAEPAHEVKLDWARSPLILVRKLDAPIKSAKSNCDCMDADIGGENKNELRIHVESSVFIEDSVRALHVEMEDGSKRELAYEFIVPIALKLSSPSLLWERGQAATAKTLRISIPQGSPITRLEDAAMDKENFHLSTKTLKAGSEYEITLTPKQTDKAQLVRLIISTDSPYAHYKKYLVYLRVK